MASTSRAESRNSTERDEANGLVRRFSQRVGEDYPQNHLAQALACSEEYEQAREDDYQGRGSLQALLNSEVPGASKSAIALLDAEMVQMKDAWTKLICTTSGVDKALLGTEKFDFGTVRNAIELWSQRYEKKQEIEYSNAKGHFSRFCETMDSYSGLLSFIPDDDKYIKPFCGMLTTIVQASVNRGKIANGFASALADIGMEMTYWKDQLSVFHRQKSVASSDGLTRIVVQLLTRIFRFLVPYLNWGQSGWERFKGSVNKNYYESNILGPLEEVKKFSEYLKREAGVQNSKHLARTEELAEIGLTLGGSMLAATKENSERLKNIERYLQTILAKRESKDRVAGLSDDEIVSLCQSFAGKMYVGDCGKGMLMANFEEATYRQRMGAASKSSPKVFESDDVIEADQQGTTTNELTFTELELRSRSLGVATTGFLGDTTQGPQQTSGKVFLSLATVGLGVSESQIAYVVSWPYC